MESNRITSLAFRNVRSKETTAKMANHTRTLDISAEPSQGVSSPKEVKDISRSISIAAQNFLWGRAAGRCEFAGCNKPLWKSSVTSERVNIAQKAHIYSFSEEGPRGN